MTGYKSKKAAAQDKMAPKNDTLVKRLRDTASRGVSVWGELMLEAADALEQPAREPVAWVVYDRRGGSKSLHWPEQHSPNGDATIFDAVPLVPQRPWVGMTEEETSGFTQNEMSVVKYVSKVLQEKNI